VTTHDSTVGEPILKLASVWAAVGITSWADAASALAAIYTVLLIGEWVYKKFFKSKV
jgi:hypothetical protein